MQEKRKFVRIDWPIVVQYKALEEPCTEDQIVSKDISEGGISFIVYERLPKWTRLDMQIQVPFDSMPIFVKGKVVWVKKVTGAPTKAFEAGVIFSEVDPKDQKRLKTYIENELKTRRTISE